MLLVAVLAVASACSKDAKINKRLDGEWKVDAQGVVTVTCPNATVQIFRSAKGEPQISMSFEGTLSVRPFWRTDLKYPGVGKE